MKKITLNFQIGENFYDVEFDILPKNLHIIPNTFKAIAIDAEGEDMNLSLDDKRLLLQWVKDNKMDEIIEQSKF